MKLRDLGFLLLGYRLLQLCFLDSDTFTSLTIAPGLPDKREYVLYTPLTALQRAFYEGIQA